MKKAVLNTLILLSVILACATTGRFQPARVSSQKEIDYPLSAQLARIEGDVTAAVFVNTDGKSEEVRITETSGHDVLDSAAYHFINTLTFDPAVLDKKPVSSWMRLILRYKLTDIAFEERRWLDEVLGLAAQIPSATPAERLDLQRKLYVRYVGLANYVEKFNHSSINTSIRRACSRETVERWQSFWDILPIPFAVFDDFLTRHPDSEIADLVREEFIRRLMDSEAELRVLAFKSKKVARIAPDMIAVIKKRLDEVAGN